MIAIGIHTVSRRQNRLTSRKQRPTASTNIVGALTDQNHPSIRLVRP